MADTRYSKKQIVSTRRRRQIELADKRLRKLLADLSFDEIIVLQELWERQHQAIGAKRTFN
jgi:hypothetical protein